MQNQSKSAQAIELCTLEKSNDHDDMYQQVFDSKDLHCHIYTYLETWQILYTCVTVSKLWAQRAYEPASFVKASNWNLFKKRYKSYNGYNPILRLTSYNPKKIFSRTSQAKVRQFFGAPSRILIPAQNVARFQNIKQLTWNISYFCGKIDMQTCDVITNSLKKFTKIEQLTIDTVGLKMESLTPSDDIDAYDLGRDHKAHIILLTQLAQHTIKKSDKLKVLHIDGSYSRKYRKCYFEWQDKWECDCCTPTISIVLKSTFTNLEVLSLSHLRFNNDMTFPHCTNKIHTLSLSSLMTSIVFFQSLIMSISDGSLKKMKLFLIVWDRRLTVVESEERMLADIIISKLCYGCQLELDFCYNICSKYILQQISHNSNVNITNQNYNYNEIVRRLYLKIPGDSFRVNFAYILPGLEELRLPFPNFPNNNFDQFRNLCHLFGNVVTAADCSTVDKKDSINVGEVPIPKTSVDIFGSNLRIIKLFGLTGTLCNAAPTLIDTLAKNVQFYDIKYFEIAHHQENDLLLFDDLVILMGKIDKLRHSIDRFSDAMLLKFHTCGIDVDSLRSAMEIESDSGYHHIHTILTLLKNWYINSLIDFDWIFHKKNMKEFEQIRNVFIQKQHFGEWICGADMEDSVKSRIIEKRLKNDICTADEPMCAVMADRWCLDDDEVDDETYQLMIEYNKFTHGLFVRNAKAQLNL